jgi:sugar-specific transcriptional regulator TrmB
MQLVPEKDDFDVLSELGLTKNQIKIYLSLLKLGTPTKAIRIFQVSGVPRQDVYRVLLELQQLGIVEKIISRPSSLRLFNLKKRFLS